MTTSAEHNQDLQDSYLEWVARQGVPVIEDFGINVGDVPVKQWDRYGMKGAFCHLKARDDYLTIFAFEIGPGGQSAPIRHIYDEVIYVISGHGLTTVKGRDGRKHSFEWGPKSIFSIPLNAEHQHFNGSGTEPVRFASGNNMTYVMNRFRNEELIFNCPTSFPERFGGEDYFDGEGEFIGIKPGKHQWETNFVSDLSSFELQSCAARGAGGSVLRFILGGSSIGVHCSEMPVGTYKKAHRHFDGVSVFAVTGQGYSLLWYDGETDFTRIDWKHGWVYSPPDAMFHQHFNTAPIPSRYLALQMGTVRYPLLRMKEQFWEKATSVNRKLGGAQIEYEDQDQRVHRIWRDEIAKTGVDSRMGPFIDETPYFDAARAAGKV